MSSQRSFLKWAGNKYGLIEKIQSLLPTEAKRLIEPFAGSATISLNMHYPKFLLAEKNADLINLYQQLKKEGSLFIDFIESFFTLENRDKERFYEFREQFNSSKDKRLKSALFIYLNRHGFNGLCRYNSKGIFNVPVGSHESIYFPRKELEAFLARSKKFTFVNQDFAKTMSKAKKGDVIYCDPPYVPLSKSADFTAYSPDGFNQEQQIELADIAKRCANKGIPVLISNHATDFTRELYQGAEQHEIMVRRRISRDSSTREPVLEILALFK